MIKFVLAFIAVILMVLGIYVYSNQRTENNTPTPTLSEKKKEVKQIEKVSLVTQDVKEQKSSVKGITVKSPKVVSQEPDQEIGDTDEIGKNLTLESIENDNVSDEEKDHMLDDLAHYQINNVNIEAEEYKRKTIGQGLSLESIMSADVSDMERKLMLDDLAYFETSNINMDKEINLRQDNIK